MNYICPVKNVLGLVSSLFAQVILAQGNFTNFINPMVGTGGHGHTFPGACVPFGMVQLSPDTRIDGSWDGCSGYHYSDSVIYGFSHTHLSGTGVSDYGDVAFMPSFVDKDIEPIKETDAFTAVFNHANEVARAGYYTVKLHNGLQVELSATARTGVQRYTAPRNGIIWVQLDLTHRDELVSGTIEVIDSQNFVGYRQSKAWATNQWVYFASHWSKKPSDIKMFANDKGIYKAYFKFKMQAWESIELNTALSSVSQEGAVLNLNTEMVSIYSAILNSKKLWQHKMQKIGLEGADTQTLYKFYTALYHCMIHPNIMNDVDGKYRGRDGKIHTVTWDGNYYTVFSLWDTYRALHPLLNLIEPEISRDFMHTFYEHNQQSGRLPMWELWGNETNCMIGMHSIPVIWNTYLNGNINKSMLEKLYYAAVQEITHRRPDFKKYMEKGYLEVQDESESVSKTVEFSFNFHCLELMAYSLKLYNDAIKWKTYAHGYNHLYNHKTGFIQPRSNGQWLANFDPYQVNNHYTEANAWQYFQVPHSKHESKYSVQGILLDDIFKAKTETSGREQADITGLIGQYAHGNEPSHHYLYDYIGKNPEQAKTLIAKVCKEFYTNSPDGLIGNEDCGQMSAWYVFSTMGFYPKVYSDNFTYGNMDVNKVTLATSLGVKTFLKNNPLKPQKGTIKVHSFNMHELKNNDTLFFETYKMIEAGIELFDIASYNQNLVAPVLHVENDTLTFEGMQNENLILKYLISNKPLEAFDYSKGITTDLNQKIFVPKNNYLYAWSLNPYGYGNNQEFKPYTVYHSPAPFKPFKVAYNCRLNSQYQAIGNNSLIDNVLGDIDWRKGNWQGIQDQNLELVVTLPQKVRLKKCGLHVLQDTRSWIVYPKNVSYWASNNGIKWNLIGTVANTIDCNTDTAQIQWLIVKVKSSKKYKFVKIVATQFGALPAWHPGKGEPSFIFADELIVE